MRAAAKRRPQQTRTAQLNGKLERSHRADMREFNQLLAYEDDVDLGKKLAEWEIFYNYQRPHRGTVNLSRCDREPPRDIGV